MAISTTVNFQNEQAKLGYQPNWLVEFLSIGEFFASREPAFTGTWTAGDGLTAGSGIKAGDAYPTYDTFLSQLTQGGVGKMSYEFDSAGLARTGASAASILNGEFFHKIADDENLTNAKIRIRLGFDGTAFSDYIAVFQGVLDDWVANLETMELDLLDDTLKNIIPFPPIIGSDIFPDSITVGQTIPVILGDVTKVPLIKIVGDVTGTLAFTMTIGDTEVLIFESTAAFPPSGEITITGTAGTEVIQYTSTEIRIIDGQSYKVFDGLTRTAPLANTALSTVTLTSFNYQYIAGLETQDPRKLREPAGVHPSGTITLEHQPIAPSGSDPRKALVVVNDTEEDDITLTVGSRDRQPNLIVNGEGDASPSTVGWVSVNGTWDTTTPSGESEPVIRGNIAPLQAVQSELRQDVTTVIGERYRLTFTMRNDTASWQTVRVGNTTDANSIFDFGEFSNTTEQGFDLTFTADATTTRVTLIVDNSTTPAEAYFDHFVLYDLVDDIPSNAISEMLARHNLNVVPDPVSFSESETRYRDAQDRIGGVIQQTEELQSLLGRIAAQFRAKTFLDESGFQKWKVFDNSAAPIYQFNESHVKKGTLSIFESPLDAVFVNYFVYFNRDPSGGQANVALGGREGFLGVIYATPEGTNHSTQPILSTLCQSAKDEFRLNSTHEIFADMIPDAGTAERLLDLICRLGTHRPYRVRFTTFLNAVQLELADVVRMRHVLFPDSIQNKTFEVLAKELEPNGCDVTYTIQEIRQSAFSSFTENWEPLGLAIPSIILAEDWDIEDELTEVAETGCNPFLELWEPSVTLFSETWERRLYDKSITDQLMWFFDFNDLSTGTINGDATTLPRNLGFYPPDDFPTVGVDRRRKSLVVERVFTINPPAEVTQEVFVVSSDLGGTFTSVQGNYTIGSSFEMRTISSGSNFSRFTTGASASNFKSWQGVNVEKDFTVQVWAQLATKGVDSQPVYHFFNAESLGGGVDAVNLLMLWWDKDDDRFRVSIAENTGDLTLMPLEIDDYISTLTDIVTADALGAPALNTWYHIVVTFDSSTNTLRIRINDASENSSVITPSLGSAQPVSLVNDLNIGGFLGSRFHIRNNEALNTPKKGAGWSGKTTLFGGWQRVLTGSEITDLYNGGSGYGWPFA